LARMTTEKEDKKRVQAELKDVSGCLSCGLPFDSESRKAVVEIGEVCSRCIDRKGHLKGYNEVHEALVTDHFIKKQKLDRPSAEKAATAQMKKVPAWKDL